jgi:hypothetical protein
MKATFRFIQYSHLFTAIAAFCFTLSAYLVLSLTVNFAIILTNFFGVLVIYSLQSLVYVAKPLANETEAKEWQRHHKKTIWFLIFLSCIWLFELITVFDKSILYLYALAATIAVFYYLPKIGLRRLPFLKNVLLAIVWLCVCVCIPVMQSEGTLLPTVSDPLNPVKLESIHFLLFYGFAFFIILYISFWFDKRDAAIDQSNASKTLVSSMNDKLFLKWLVIFAAIFLSCMMVINFNYLLAVCMIFAYLFIMLLKLRRNSIDFLAYGYWGDGLLVWTFIAFVANELVWELLQK